MNKKIKEENIKFFNKLKDCKDLQERKYLQEELFILNQKLIWMVINRVGYKENNLMSNEDYFSVGSQGLIKAIRNFDADKYDNFATFAYSCIFNEIGMEMVKINKITKNEISLQSNAKKGSNNSDKEEGITYEDVLPSCYNVIEVYYDDEMKNNLNDIIETKLDSVEQNCIKDYYGLDNRKEKMQKEIAKENSIPRSYISRKTQRLREVIKKELIQKYIEDELTF